MPHPLTLIVCLLHPTYACFAAPAAAQMVARRIGPTSNMWRAQNLVNMNLVAGINCEYHHMCVRARARHQECGAGQAGVYCVGLGDRWLC